MTVVTPIGNAAPDTYVLDTEGVPQLSVAVGATHVATAVVAVTVAVCTLIFAGQLANIGFSVSVAQGSTAELIVTTPLCGYTFIKSVLPERV